MAPKLVRQKATPIGVRAVRAYSTNRNEPPQIRPAIEYMASQGLVVPAVIYLALVVVYLSHSALSQGVDNHRRQYAGH